MRLLLVLASLSIAFSAQLELVSIQRIWDQAPHSAFGDLIHFRGRWFCVFREGQWHVARAGQEDDGKLRVITSPDGKRWTSASVIAEEGIDLRDPHFSVTADGRLMIVAGGSEYPQGRFQGRQPRVMFSRDGVTWSAPRKALERSHWLWRVTWHKGRAYGVTKFAPPDNSRRLRLVASADGLAWESVAELDVPGGDETTLRFLPDGRMVALTRRTGNGDDHAMIGISNPPFQQWQWTKTAGFLGGPNFIVLPGGAMVAGGRSYPDGNRAAPKTVLGFMNLTSYEPSLALPSGGDSSYPGFFWRQGILWTMYYSSHEGKTAIYLAKVRVKD